ncbi:DUF6197 family protein [Streptomyces sp. BH097]|uniref:DUF6197 family protein n=1 Tax=unclassified Streptomyces TaxID=2593676 RepID=UPI003BB66C55
MSVTRTPTTPARPTTAAAPLSLEERLVLANTAMTARLDEAAVAYEVNTAHLAVNPLDLDAVVTTPITPADQPHTHRTPVAALLHRAHFRLVTDGWCKDQLVDVSGARCLLGAIQAEAGGNRRLEQNGLDALMDAIRSEFADAETIPSFNDAWSNSRTPLRLLDTAARRADAHGL